MQESPLELSFQVIATRKVKKRRHIQQTVVNNGSPEVAIDTIPSSRGKKPPEPSSSGDGDDIGEPPEKVAKMENNSIDETHEGTSDYRKFNPDRSRVLISHQSPSHITPLSPEDHHGRPPTPPETPEGHQHILMQTPTTEETKCEEMSSEELYEEDNNIGELQPQSDEADDEDAGIGDQDSEAPLEVDTSHETEPELEIEMEQDEKCTKNDVDNINRLESTNSVEDVDNFQGQKEIEGESRIESSTDQEIDQQETKPRRIRRNVVVQAGQDGSCAFSDSDSDEAIDESGALDLSDHARNVREARAKEGGDISRGQGTQTILSITQSKTSKRKNKLQTQNNVSPPVTNTATSWPQANPTHAAAFHDLLTLSQAAVLQIALVRAQEEHKKSLQAAALSKMSETSDSLSFVNGSGDTLTISAGIFFYTFTATLLMIRTSH